METAVCMDLPLKKHLLPFPVPNQYQESSQSGLSLRGTEGILSPPLQLGEIPPHPAQRDIPGGKEDKRVEKEAVWELFQKQIPSSSVLLLELKACK